MRRPPAGNPAPRFGIAEWYGRNFVTLTADERLRLAETAIGDGEPAIPPCPFRPEAPSHPCVKKGGVCSIRLYQATGGGEATPLPGVAGRFTTLCPHRFKQEGLIYRAVGSTLLGITAPVVVSEVRFLKRVVSQHAGAPQNPVPEPGGHEVAQEDVGNIDHVLVAQGSDPLRWCALEMQAVYFSGKGMGSLFRAIRSRQGTGVPFPDAARRPDFRSSAPKRLMPQLQIKVPTLSRWGKKTGVVVDAPFFASLGNLRLVPDLSNADIAWFVVQYDEGTDPCRAVVRPAAFQTLEHAVEGLTMGVPVTQSEFESKIREKLGSAGA